MDQPMKDIIWTQNESLEPLDKGTVRSNGAPAAKTAADANPAIQQYVTGWLVCIKGAAIGQDFRLRDGWNTIGSGLEADICLPDTIEHNHASIFYEKQKNRFYFLRGHGFNCFVNDRLVLEVEPLHEGDKLSICGSEFLFIPFCKELRRWSM